MRKILLLKNGLSPIFGLHYRGSQRFNYSDLNSEQSAVTTTFLNSSTTLIYTNDILTSASESLSVSQGYNINIRVPQDTTQRLDDIEQQLAMITHSVSLLTQLMARAFKSKAVLPQKFNSAKEPL